MIEEYLPVVYAGIAGTVLVFVGKAYYNFRIAAIKAAKQEKIDLNKPEAAIDQLVAQVQNAPAALQMARAELEDIRKKNPGVNLKSQEEKIKWLELLNGHRDKILMFAPVAAPLLKNFVKGLSKAF